MALYWLSRLEAAHHLGGGKPGFARIVAATGLVGQRTARMEMAA
jgi:hypothetical protein